MSEILVLKDVVLAEKTEDAVSYTEKSVKRPRLRKGALPTALKENDVVVQTTTVNGKVVREVSYTVDFPVAAGKIVQMCDTIDFVEMNAPVAVEEPK